MNIIDPHIHISSRTANDLIEMRNAGIKAVIEPAFWLGQPRTNIGSFKDYYSALVGWERFRCAQFGIRHYCAIGLNSKESNNQPLAEEVMDLLPFFICKEGVVAIGEIGFDDMTDLEEHYFKAQLQLALEYQLPVIVHTPHRDKKRGTLRSMDICREMGLAPDMVVIDHNNEETVGDVLDQGYWAGFTIYPKTKMGNERMVDIVRQYGADHIIVNSSADWGYSDHLAVPKTAKLMLQRGINQQDVQTVCYQNAISMFSQSGQFNEADWLNIPETEEYGLFEGNSVLRGQNAADVTPLDSQIIT